MTIAGAIMVPHPPLIIPEVGRGQEWGIRQTIQGYHKAVKRLAAWKPDTVVVLSPHSVMYADYFHISPGKGAQGNFWAFRAPQVSISVSYDSEFADALSHTAARCGVSAGTLGERDSNLDHGTMIPLWFLNQYYEGYEVVRIGLSGLPFSQHYKLGQCIQKTADQLGRCIAVIASGDLSHKLKEDGPYGFQEEGPVYDEHIMDCMGKGDFGRLFALSPSFCAKAAECGHRSFLIMAGVLDGLAVTAEPISYEGPFGVGYGICVYETEGPAPGRDFLSQYEAAVKEQALRRKGKEDAYVRLARQTIETYIRTGSKGSVPAGLPSEMYERKAGVFVSLKKEGVLRGCIGTIEPVQHTIAEEIMANAVNAAVRDPRFPAVKAEELEQLEYSVDVLRPAEVIASEEELDVQRYGVIVTKGCQRGLLLPNLEGIDTAAEQVAIAKRKAGIDAADKDVQLERFEVVRHY